MGVRSTDKGNIGIGEFKVIDGKSIEVTKSSRISEGTNRKNLPKVLFDVLLIAGGGGGGSAGGGGAGGMVQINDVDLIPISNNIVSETANYGVTFTVTIGNGGAYSPHTNGGDTILSNPYYPVGIVTAVGGGRGGICCPNASGYPGGSGGGVSGSGPGNMYGGGALQPTRTYPTLAPGYTVAHNAGNIGGSGYSAYPTSGGGGAGGSGGGWGPNTPATGGDGLATDILTPGTPITYAGGGSGSNAPGYNAPGGGGSYPAGSGTVNTGGGAGGGGSGGSGFAVIRFPVAANPGLTAPQISCTGTLQPAPASYVRIYKFTGTGTFSVSAP